MNFKRGRPKNRRAGCLCCKPHKANGCEENQPAVARQLQVGRDERLEDLDEPPFFYEDFTYCDGDPGCDCAECTLGWRESLEQLSFDVVSSFASGTPLP